MVVGLEASAYALPQAAGRDGRDHKAADDLYAAEAFEVGDGDGSL